MLQAVDWLENACDNGMGGIDPLPGCF